jgi:crotonobetainyl-CoA:carnitine CoA-transferase CaiB-like acyl-CoA transferase
LKNTEEMMVEHALKGLRVLDLCWVIAGPFATKILADMGAEVIKIESYRKLDGLRMVGPWRDQKPTPPDRSGAFDTRNVNKLSMALDLKSTAGVEIFKRLVKVSDVIVENFSAGTMDKFGLGYSVLGQINPKIIMVSLAGFGQTGPYRDYVSFGPNLQAISGLTSITGWPGRVAVGIGQAYPDFVGGLYTVFAILASLRHRNTGRGLHIDLSQYEGAVSTLGHSVLEYTVNNRIPQPAGNRHTYACPHGCYRCQGDERWCVIAVFNDEEWQSFCDVIGNPDWVKNPEFATFLGRKKAEDKLDRLIEEWTIKRSAEEVMELMQGAGVAAGVVQNVEDLLRHDRHMKARGYYQELDHPPIGKSIPEGIPFKFSLTPGSLRTPGPLLGEHNDYVLKTVLGMSQQEIDKLASEGAFR